MNNFTSPFNAFSLAGGISLADGDARYAQLGTANAFTLNGTASTSAISLTGTPFAGTGSNAFPLLYLNQTGATAATNLSTAGTFFGINISGSQDIAHWLKNGATRFKVDSVGSLTCGSSSITGAYSLTIVTSYGSVNFNQTGSGDLVISRSIVGPGSGFLRFGYSGATDPILQASASAWTISQAKLITQASATGLAGFNIPAGTAPTSPVNGDMWQDGTDIKIRIGGVTKTFTIL